MGRTADERRALAEVRDFVQRRYETARGRQRELHAFSRARQRAERGFKRGMADRLYAAAGIDRAEAEARVERDRVAVIAFMKQQAASAKRESRRVARGQRDYAREYFRRAQHLRPSPGSATPPVPFVEVLTTASGIDVRDAQKSATSIAPHANIARLQLHAEHHAPPFTFSVGAWQWAHAAWTFSWSPPGDGELRTAAFLLVNGYRMVWCEPGCGNGGSAGATLSTVLSVAQGRFSGPMFIDSTPAEVIYDTRVHKGVDESTGAIDAGSLDLPWVVSSGHTFPVVDRRPVFISVELWLRVDCSSGQSLLDLFEKDFQANVPGVIVTLG